MSIMRTRFAKRLVTIAGWTKLWAAAETIAAHESLLRGDQSI
jgi:hypothetical protein